MRLSSRPRTGGQPTSSTVSAPPIVWVGLDVHKDSVTAAVFRDRDPNPMRVDRLVNDHTRIRRYFERLSAAGSPRVCYEASAEQRRQGAITKAGNSRCRHVLVQAAWCYRRRPTVGASLKRRQEGQNPSVIAHAWKCQHRLYNVFHRLAAKKPRQVAATAVARELIGFIWAALHDIDVTQLPQAQQGLESQENAHTA